MIAIRIDRPRFRGIFQRLSAPVEASAAVADLQRQILYATSLVLLAIGGAATLLAVFG